MKQHYRTVILKGAKHFIQEDAPEEICYEILAQEKLNTIDSILR